MPHPRVARTLFDLVVVIGGTNYRCAQVTMNFSLNKIPTATCTLAVGRHVHTLQAANAHRTLFTANAGTATLKPAEIHLLPAGDWRPAGEQWPDGATVIFRGYATGVGVRMVRGSMRATVHLIHWLADLNFSSALSEQSHPVNPADLAWKAVYVGEGRQTDTPEPHFIHQTAAVQTFTAGAIQTDLWAECLQPFLWRLTERDQIETIPGLGGPEPSNAQAQAALQRIQGGEHGTEPGLDYTALSLHRMGSYDVEVARAIQWFLQHELATSWWSSTMWNKLVNQIAPAFMFAIVPQVESALIAPYLPGMRKVWKTIENSEYLYIDTVSAIPRPIKTVAIYMGIVTETGEGGSKSPGREILVGGKYTPDGATKGMLMLLTPPGWLQQLPTFGENAGNTAGGDPNGALDTIPTSTCADVEGNAGNEDGHTIEDVAINSEDFFDRYAKSIYAGEMLRGRFGVLYGKLRFDIAPGSTVFIQGSADPWLGDDALRPNLIADVQRVTCSLNAEGSKAGTSFQLTHLRTEAENDADATSIETHPLFNKEFSGSPLSEALAFRPEEDEDE